MSEYDVTPIDKYPVGVENLLTAFQELYESGNAQLWGYQLSGDLTETIYEDPHLPDKTLHLLEQVLGETVIALTCDPLTQLAELADMAAQGELDDSQKVSENVVEELQEVLAQIPDETEYVEEENPSYEIHWAESGPFVAEGVLTHLLISGGVLNDFPGSTNDARKLSGDFVDALIEDRHLQAQVAICDQAWSPWFTDEVSDFSMFLYDKPQQRIYLLCLTDTDTSDEELSSQATDA